LTQVKHEITTLTNYLNLQQHRRDAGLPAHPLSLHMVFRGNPGTGKTTVARIVGRIFSLLGLLQRGHLVETDRAGLVAEYAGQTAPKANRKIDEALDGILFIDEAYSLVADRGQDAYGSEAVQALVKRMEDDRHRLVVILAGYPEPMDKLLASNPGLSSRFNTQLLFEDYEPVQLAQIYQLMCDANHYELPGSARAKLLLGFHWLYQIRDEHFGNGRLVRNVFENAVRRLANRVAAVTPVTRELLTHLTADDLLLSDIPADHWKYLDDPKLRFSVVCDHCQKPVYLRGDQLGRRVRCPHCRTPFQADWGCWVSGEEKDG
jgi:replication-associated recombination protein RarA